MIYSIKKIYTNCIGFSDKQIIERRNRKIGIIIFIVVNITLLFFTSYQSQKISIDFFGILPIFYWCAFAFIMFVAVIMQYKFREKNTILIINYLEKYNFIDLSNRILKGFEKFGPHPSRGFSHELKQRYKAWKEFHKLQIPDV